MIISVLKRDRFMELLLTLHSSQTNAVNVAGMDLMEMVLKFEDGVWRNQRK